MQVTLLAIALVIAVRTAGHAADWPEFLAARDSFGVGVAAAVDRVWSEPTLTRTVAGPPASAPLDLYRRFIDRPDVTAAAARRLGVAKYEVRSLADGWYEADDRQGARGKYVVLARDEGRRVILSSGSHRGRLLGTLTGSALTVLTFEEHGNVTTQKLTTYVRIDNALAAALARRLARIVGHLADRKLVEGLNVARTVAEWAMQNPDDFCRWLAGEPAIRARFLDAGEGQDDCSAATLGRRRASRGGTADTGR